MTPSIDPATSALLVMDFQTAVVGMVVPEPADLLARTAALVERARAAGLRVIHVVVGFRPGYPELSPDNQLYAPMRASGRFTEGAAGTEVHAAVAPRPGDVVVTKRRTSAFFATDLDLILRAGGITTLVLAGIATSGVVLATVRHAADADYRLVVVEDCCADRDPEVHRVLMDKVFARWTTVLKAEAVFPP
jgi:nicotinamidase-related amidase